MYYLDLFRLYRTTRPADRKTVRFTLDRDTEMAYRLKLQHGLCFFCGREITMADHLDHLLPVYYGGLSNRANLVAACRTCNLLKSTQQIAITNPHIIKDYLNLIRAKKKWKAKLLKHPWLKRYQPPKRVRLYKVYRADLFRSV